MFRNANTGFVGSTAGVVDTTEKDWQHTMAANLTSVWLCMKYEIPEMLKRQHGAIVNNGSVSGLVGSPIVDSPDGEARQIRGTLLAVLKKLPDGSWRVFRALGGTAPRTAKAGGL
jgi:NAD(P)-dependent dehydrogenase (short-subunit alcohol dehydrogenase family)